MAAEDQLELFSVFCVVCETLRMLTKSKYRELQQHKEYMQRAVSNIQSSISRGIVKRLRVIYYMHNKKSKYNTPFLLNRFFMERCLENNLTSQSYITTLG